MKSESLVKRNINNISNINSESVKTEEELHYYKNLSREYERQIDELKRSQQHFNGVSGNGSFKNNSIRDHKNYITNKNIIDKEKEERKFSAPTYEDNVVNSSLDNYRRNKVIN